MMRRKLVLNSSKVFFFKRNIFTSINLDSIGIFYLIPKKFVTI